MALAKRFDRLTVQLTKESNTSRSAIPPLPSNMELLTASDRIPLTQADFDAALLLGVLSSASGQGTLPADSLHHLRERARLMVVEFAPHARTEAQKTAVAIEHFLRNNPTFFPDDCANWPTLSTLRSQLERCELHHLRAIEVSGTWTTRFGDTETTPFEEILQRLREDFSADDGVSPSDSLEREVRFRRIEKTLRQSGLAPLDLFVLHGIYKSYGNSPVQTTESSPTNSKSHGEAFDVNSFSLAELLSLVMTNGESSTRMSKLTSRILQEYGSRAVAEERHPHRLCEALAIPLTRATQIVALFEIGHRFFTSSNLQKVLLRGPEDIAAYVSEMADLQCEQFRILCIDAQLHLIREEIIGIGGETHANLHPRDVLQPALLCGAAQLAFIHNHPSGDPSPSARDIEVTRVLCRAAEIVGISILDHVIISGNGWFSMRNQCLLP